MSGIENAAEAFERAMNPVSTPAPKAEGKPSAGTAERMFGAEHDDSELAGGDGDDSDLPGSGDVFDEDADDEDEGRVNGDSDESGEDEDESDDEGGDEDDEDEGGELPPELLSKEVEITVDGQPTKVSLKEALEGYIRTETFHRRLNEVNETKKQIEKESEDITKARTFYANMLKNLADELDAVQPQEPNWDAEYEKDPVAAARLERQWNRYKEQRQTLRAEQDRVSREEQAENAKRFAQWADGERQKLLTAKPEWANNETWQRDNAAIRKTAKAAGMTDAELSQIYDSRYLLLLDKAAKYDRLMAKNGSKPQKVSNGGNGMRPGSGNAGRTGPKGNADASARLSRTGSIRDAASVFASVLQSETRKRKK